MRKVIFLSLLFCLLFLSHYLNNVQAENDSDRRAELQRQIEEYEKQISSLHTKANTLTNQISQFNAQIKVTELKISQTQEQINLLSNRINQLSTSLEGLTRAYNSRVVETYKMGRVGDPSLLIAISEDLNKALSFYNYLKLAQSSDHTLLERLVKAQTGYQGQKKEFESLQETLSQQKKTLDSQKQSKALLLTVTQSDEKKYQALLADAQKQLAAFKHFTEGATVLSNQTKCDSWGCYYNQRDSSWANNTIGGSSNTMKDVGCLITSMAMIASHYGKSIKPVDIASSNIPFFGNTAYMIQGTWSVNGVTMTRSRLGSSTSHIDSELAANRPVVVGIYGGPDHFVVIKAKENGNYIMNDPFAENGGNIKFTDKYPLSAITVVDRVSVN